MTLPITMNHVVCRAGSVLMLNGKSTVPAATVGDTVQQITQTSTAAFTDTNIDGVVTRTATIECEFGLFV